MRTIVNYMIHIGICGAVSKPQTHTVRCIKVRVCYAHSIWRAEKLYVAPARRHPLILMRALPLYHVRKR
jgi:hypothetical protein